MGARRRLPPAAYEKATQTRAARQQERGHARTRTPRSTPQPPQKHAGNVQDVPPGHGDRNVLYRPVCRCGWTSEHLYATPTAARASADRHAERADERGA